MAQHGKILWSVAQSCAILVLVHDDIEPPMQPVFHAPMGADDLTEPFTGQCRAEQIVSG